MCMRVHVSGYKTTRASPSHIEGGSYWIFRRFRRFKQASKHPAFFFSSRVPRSMPMPIAFLCIAWHLLPAEHVSLRLPACMGSQMHRALEYSPLVLSLTLSQPVSFSVVLLAWFFCPPFPPKERQHTYWMMSMAALI